MIQALVNPAFPARLQLSLGTLTGPLVSAGSLGAFQPLRDLAVYVDGTPLTFQTAVYDMPENRYLLFAGQVFDTYGVIQVFHHMPSLAFTGRNGQLPGLALIAGVTKTGD